MSLVFTPHDLPFRIRQSLLEDARCLHRTKVVHVDKRRDPESEFAQRGTDFHELSKLYVDFLKNSRQDSDWEFADELLERKDWNVEAAAIFKNWVRETVFEPESVFATEYKIRLDWDLKPVDEAMPGEYKRTVFSADLDRLDIVRREALIVDYKTHFMAFKPTTIQAVIYPWMLFKTMPDIDTVKFQLEFVRWGIKSEPREFTRDNLPMMDRYVQQQVLRLIGALDTNDWPATPNTKCAYCMLECPLVKSGMSREVVGQIQTKAHAEEMTRELYTMRQAAKRLHTALKNWAMEAGPIDGGNDIRLGFSLSEKYEFDTETIVRLNKAHGFSPMKTLKPATREVKKVGVNYPEYVNEAKKTANDKSTTNFKFWNEVGDPLDQEEED